MLINGGLEIWSRGAGPFTGNGTFGADRWQTFLQGSSTLSISRDTANADAGSLYCAACGYGHNQSSVLYQRLEGYAELRGRTLTLSVRIKTTTAAAIRPGLYDGTTKSFGPYHSGSGAYETLTVTAAMPVNATAVHAEINFDLGGTFYVDSAVLVIGTKPGTYAPQQPADDVLRCQRYYQEVGGLDPFELLGVGENTGTTGGQLILRFPVEMFGAPTVTVSAAGDWQAFDAAGASLSITTMTPGLITRRSCRLVYAVASGLVAGNACLLRAANTNARIRLESNP